MTFQYINELMAEYLTECEHFYMLHMVSIKWYALQKQMAAVVADTQQFIFKIVYKM